MSTGAEGPMAPIDDRRVEDTAADWLARREAGLTVEEQAEFSQWLLADSRHADTVRQLESAWRFLQQPRFTGQAGEVERAVAERVGRQQRLRRRRLVGFAFGGLAAAAALAFAWLGTGGARPGATAAPAASVAVKPEGRTLPDGSVVELNAGAEIAVDFTPARRDVRLVRGEAHFAVTKDVARPFVVTAGTVTVRAVGTAFAVRFEPERVGVLVTEGRVAVDRVPAALAADMPPAPPTFLTAGRHLTVPMAAPVTAPLRSNELTAAEMKAALAWRGMRVEFTNMPLAEIVDLFNQRNRVQLALGDPGLGDIRISGVFWADDPEGFSRLVGSSAGLQAVRSTEVRIVLRR